MTEVLHTFYKGPAPDAEYVLLPEGSYAVGDIEPVTDGVQRVKIEVGGAEHVLFQFIPPSDKE